MIITSKDKEQEVQTLQDKVSTLYVKLFKVILLLDSYNDKESSSYRTGGTGDKITGAYRELDREANSC